MSKAPVPDLLGRPSCYGIHHHVARKLCKPCRFQATCAVRSQTQRERKSLSQLAAEAEAALFRAPEHEPFAVIYQHVYERVFGERLWVRTIETPRAVAMFAKVAAYCAEAEIDPELWIQAQMEAIKPRLLKMKAIPGARVTSFQPNMLSGEKAKYRYNDHIRLLNRKTQQVEVDSMPQESALFHVLCEIAQEECRLLWFLSQSRIAGETMTVAEAVQLLDMLPEWQFVAGLASIVPGADRETVWRLDKVRNAAVLKGADYCAAMYSPHWSNRIGVNLPFDHSAFADLIVQMCSRIVRDPKEHGPIRPELGHEWRPTRKT
jgi:hypothetical protein